MSVYNFNRAYKEARKAMAELKRMSFGSSLQPTGVMIGITEKQGMELLHSCQNYKASVENIYERSDRAGIKIKGVWFYWDKNEVGRAA